MNSRNMFEFDLPLETWMKLLTFLPEDERLKFPSDEKPVCLRNDDINKNLKDKEFLKKLIQDVDRVAFSTEKGEYRPNHTVNGTENLDWSETNVPFFLEFAKKLTVDDYDFARAVYMFFCTDARGEYVQAGIAPQQTNMIKFMLHSFMMSINSSLSETLLALNRDVQNITALTLTKNTDGSVTIKATAHLNGIQVIGNYSVEKSDDGYNFKTLNQKIIIDKDLYSELIDILSDPKSLKEILEKIVKSKMKEQERFIILFDLIANKGLTPSEEKSEDPDTENQEIIQEKGPIDALKDKFFTYKYLVNLLDKPPGEQQKLFDQLLHHVLLCTPKTDTSLANSVIKLCNEAWNTKNIFSIVLNSKIKNKKDFNLLIEDICKNPELVNVFLELASENDHIQESIINNNNNKLEYSDILNTVRVNIHNKNKSNNATDLIIYELNALDKLLNGDKSIKESDKKNIQEKFLVHLLVLEKICAQDDGNTEKPDNMFKSINAVLDSFQVQMGKTVKENSQLKKIAVKLCYIMGGIVGLILTPLMPIYKMHQYAKNRLEDSSEYSDYAEAIAAGIKGFVKGTVLSPYYAWKLGSQFVKRFDWIESHKESEELREDMKSAVEKRENHFSPKNKT